MRKLKAFFKNNIYWNLFFCFFKIGMFTIGGGMAMIPILEEKICDKYGWMSSEEVLDCIADAARRAGSNPCPPMVLGVGIGGDFELCALLAKKALCRPLSAAHPDPYYAELEREALERVNALGIGPQGFGGATTALGVAIETYPTHIAGLPVAVNVGCHVTRHCSAVL